MSGSIVELHAAAHTAKSPLASLDKAWPSVETVTSKLIAFNNSLALKNVLNAGWSVSLPAIVNVYFSLVVPFV